MSRKSENFAGISVLRRQPKPVPVFGAKKKKHSGTIWRKFSTEISVQMVSAQWDQLYEEK